MNTWALRPAVLSEAWGPQTSGFKGEELGSQTSGIENDPLALRPAFFSEELGPQTSRTESEEALRPDICKASPKAHVYHTHTYTHTHTHTQHKCRNKTYPIQLDTFLV